MSTTITPPTPGGTGRPASGPPSTAAAARGETILAHVGTSIVYTVATVLLLGIVYPLAITLIGTLLFPHQAAGSLVMRDGKPVGSEIIGQRFTQPQYFWGRPSAAGKDGYDPTATGGTNLAPTSKKLIDTTRTTIAALEQANPDAVGPPPMDLVTSSGSGIDPDISPEGAAYQAPRVAKARHLPLADVRALIAAHTQGRTLGFLGEPRVNVFALNRALDATTAP